jgi:hypothetical protein
MAKKASAKKSQVKKTPVTEAPVKKAAVKEAAVKEAAVKEASVKEASVKKTEPQAKPAKPQIPARLLAAVRTVLEDADDTGRENSVVLGATAYNALRNVLHDLTGQWWGMEVEELDEEENEEIDDEEDEDYDEDEGD